MQIRSKKYLKSYSGCLVSRSGHASEALLVTDDTCAPGSSKQASGVVYPHDHSHQPNRPNVLWRQLPACLTLILHAPHRGNRSKLEAASLLTRLATRWVFPVRFDCSSMPGP